MSGAPVDRRAAGGGTAGLAERLTASHGAVDGERKQISVLFADLRGSLELLSERDPEDARRLLGSVLARMVQAVHRYDGTVNQVMGDGIMALFGAPVAFEDHAVRACRAALEIHASVAEYADSLEPGLGANLRIRVGVNSGEVVVSFVDSDLRSEYTAVGKTTHLAARLEQAAVPGTTLISDATRRLTAGYIDVRPMGPLSVKGLTTPMQVYEVIGVSAARTRLEAARARWSTPFVGRDVELAQLRQASAHAAAGHGQVVAAVGEPGVGKSRLVSEFTRSLARAGWKVLETGAVPYAQGSPYVPIVALLKDYFGVENEDDRAAIQEKVAGALARFADGRSVMDLPILELLGLSAAQEAWALLEPVRRRQEILDGLCQLFVCHSRTECLALVFEDLQGIDSETQAFLDRLVARLENERILLVVTYRPEYAHPWNGLKHFVELPVRALHAPVAEALLTDLLGADASLGSVVSLLVERAEGNPMFLEASVSDLVDAQVLVGERGAYRLQRPVTTLHVPSTVQAVLAARIDRLREADRWLLQCAAVIGKEPSVPILAAITEMSEQDVQSGIDRLRARGFLYESALPSSRGPAFDHRLTLDVALGSLLSSTRRALDARIVEALERSAPDHLGDQMERLAFHALRGELWEKAVRYSRAAAARAAARSAHRAAIDHLERALDALSHLAETPAVVEQAIDVRLELRSSLIPVGEYRRTVEYLQAAQELAQKLGDDRRLGIIHSHLANYLHLTGHIADAAQQAEHALRIAERSDDLRLRVVATSYLGSLYHTLGRLGDAVDLARRNLVTLRGRLETETFGMTSLPAVYARTYLAWALAELGDFDEADGAGAAALEIAERAQHSYSTIYAYLATGVARLRRGDFGAAVELLEKGLRLCHRLEIPVLQAIVVVPLSAAYAHAGRVTESLALLEQSGAQARRIHDPISHWIRTGALAEALVLGGRAAEAEPLALEYLRQRRSIGARCYETWAMLLLADVTAALGHDAEASARRQYEDTARLAAELRMRPVVARCRLGLGCVARREHRTERDVAELTEALQLFRTMGMAFWAARAEQELQASG